MTEQQKRAERFRDLHVKGEPLVLFNVWDAGSAKAVAASGAQAVATGSWSVAAAHGFGDGERLPLRLALENLARIVASVDLPVSCDIEGGYGPEPAAVAETVAGVLAAGAVGVNLEDGVIGGEGLYPLEVQAVRIRAAREAAKAASVALFINARTDVFLQLDPAAHDERVVDEAVRRAVAYAEAGANGFFAPGLVDAQHVETLCRRSPLPVNIMMLTGAPPAGQLAGLGVARVSYGPGPYQQAMAALTEAAHAAQSAAQS